jgi:hypothetical protein
MEYLSWRPERLRIKIDSLNCATERGRPSIQRVGYETLAERGRTRVCRGLCLDDDEVRNQDCDDSKHHQQERRVASFADNHDVGINPAGDRRFRHLLGGLQMEKAVTLVML